MKARVLKMQTRIGVLVFAFWLAICHKLPADLITIDNFGFEDTSGQTVFNEFTFGVPTGWVQYNPAGVLPSMGVFTGTLQPNGTDFFNGLAPEGDRVAIMFNSTREGDGQYGLEQTLATVLESNTRYTLSVEVGNIASGTAFNGTFFNLDEFPGYRVDLMAGNTVVAEDLNSLSIAEGEFATSTVSFVTGATHGLLGQQLGIRLVNLNEIPAGFDQASSPDLEVDFDWVQLDATAVPEPSALACFGAAAIGLMIRRRKFSTIRHEKMH